MPILGRSGLLISLLPKRAMPSSYKPAAAVAAQIESFGLAEIVDWIDPYGCIMAGDMPRYIRRPKVRRKGQD